MLELTPATVRLGATAANKEEAIRQVAMLLVEAGYIAPAYVESMLAREQQANTYLGNGIAIPHGMGQDRELIHRTGIAVLQLASVVPWKDDAQARLLIGIAARSDEHLPLLANLVDVLGDVDLATQLATTSDPQVIIRHLTRPRTPGASAEAVWEDGPAVTVPIGSHAGLHARPATVFVDLANQFAAAIQVSYNGQTANGKALAALLRLGAPHGAPIRIAARGPDAEAAVAALGAAVAAGLEDEAPTLTPDSETFRWRPARSDRAVIGVAASPGLAIGPLYHYQVRRLVVRDVAENAAREHERLHAALATAREELGTIYESVRERAGRGEAAIFRAHQALLADPELVAQVEGLIDEGHGAAWAWQRAIEERVGTLQRLADERLAARAVDLNDVGQRVLRLMVAVETEAPALPAGPVILIAEDLLPSDTARLDPRLILGLATASGGPTSHTAIIARSLGIPALVGAGPALLEQPAGAPGILDGGAGALYVNPEADDLESARRAQAELARLRNVEYQTRYEPALTTDGHRIEVLANVQRPSEAEPAVNAGAEGIGLLRTEFLFLERATPPGEEEQYEAYAAMVRALNGLPLTIRTLDIGGDKAVPYLDLPPEDNPFLGVRGLRLCLRRPDLFRPQLRAIYRAACLGPVRLMFPMVATLEELRQAKAIAEEVRLEVDAPPIDIGIMVEVPSTALMAAEFAAEADFFSIGTNDLTQYVLAMDRLHPALAKQVDGLHPAVLRLVDQVARAAQAAGRHVGVCGGVAGEPHGAAILAGLGVHELSMSIPSVAAVKARLRSLSLEQARDLARRALACRTADEVRGLTIGARVAGVGGGQR
ncbi:MAG: phosphoenolpyruvate--protein phosphotransferase [Chloroflexaceae bacterium]|nr:phosphoenolpyruvate--protein phosphotransferase [Chloroflexaceae bacterium]